MIPSEFADILHKALEDKRITTKLSDIVCGSLHQKITALERRVAELEKCQKGHEIVFDDHEQYSRRENVRIWLDVPEKNGENTDQLVLDVAKKMDVNLSLDDVSCTHRVGRVPGDNKKPRAIICQFTNLRVKSRFMKARPALKRTKIFISDDLMQRRSHIFFMARQKKKVNLCDSCWTYDGKIYICLTENGKQIIIRDTDQLDDFYVDRRE